MLFTPSVIVVRLSHVLQPRRLYSAVETGMTLSSLPSHLRVLAAVFGGASNFVLRSWEAECVVENEVQCRPFPNFARFVVVG